MTAVEDNDSAPRRTTPALKLAAMIRHLYESGYGPDAIADLTRLQLTRQDALDLLAAHLPDFQEEFLKGRAARGR